MRGGRQGKKGIEQLGHNIDQLVRGKRVISDGAEANLDDYKTIYPVLVLYEESLSLHAVRTYMQGNLTKELSSRGTPTERIGPLVLLTVRDLELLTSIAKSHTVESVFSSYSDHLSKSPNEHLGSFGGFLRSRYMTNDHATTSVTGRAHTKITMEFSRMVAGSA